MSSTHAPFAEGPPRPKQVISLGFYRTGSHSLKEALTILGLRNVFHSSGLGKTMERWHGLEAAADNNISCLPSYTGRNSTRADWEAYFGPCEALTDVTPFAESLLEAYPEARVILINRDFDSWSRSFLNTLVLPSPEGPLAWLSGHIFEPILGLCISRSVWKMYMGLIGVCDIKKTRDHRILRASYNRHYAAVRHLVPQERLLELDLKDLDWEPLCKFLGKEVPRDIPFPRLNESRVFRNELRGLHKTSFTLVMGPLAAAIGAIVGGLWFARSRAYM